METCRLQWDLFIENLVKGLKNERRNSDFVDISLAVSGGVVIHCHKLVLSIASTFFRTILKENNHPYPMIFLSDISKENLVALLDFMYFGEVEISSDQLDSFLASAERLGVLGLVKAAAEDYTAQNSQELNVYDILSVRGSSVKSDPGKNSSVKIASGKNTPIESTSSPKSPSQIQREVPDNSITPTEVLRGDELNAKIEEHCTKLGPGQLQCKICQKRFCTKRKIFGHIERHMNLKFPCNICEKECPTRHALEIHCDKKHGVKIGNPLSL